MGRDCPRELGFPRIRGDVPRPLSLFDQVGEFSSHTRGCSWFGSRPKPRQTVFPAYAGMLLIGLPENKVVVGFPRIRGDVPGFSHPLIIVNAFSPHTRGCSVPHPRLYNKPPVFPAYAGMFRGVKRSHPVGWGFPRIRGDVPVISPLLRGSSRFSPHTQGCSSHPTEAISKRSVFPAYAGIFQRQGLQ